MAPTAGGGGRWSSGVQTEVRRGHRDSRQYSLGIQMKRRTTPSVVHEDWPVFFSDDRVQDMTAQSRAELCLVCELTYKVRETVGGKSSLKVLLSEEVEAGLLCFVQELERIRRRNTDFSPKRTASIELFVDEGPDVIGRRDLAMTFDSKTENWTGTGFTGLEDLVDSVL